MSKRWSNGRASKTEQKVLAKLQRSAAANHLYEGLIYKRNYEAHEAARYWRTYKNEPFEMGSVPVFQQDTTLASLEELLVEHDRNIQVLEDQLMHELSEHPLCDCDDRTRSFCTCPCHKTDKPYDEAAATFETETATDADNYDLGPRPCRY